MMVKLVIDGVECEPSQAKGISWGIAPKIGSMSLIISTNLRIDALHFDFSKIKLRDGDYWFQCVENGKFIWSHGLVNQNGKITQIG